MKVGIFPRVMDGPEGTLSAGQTKDRGRSEPKGAGALEGGDRECTAKAETAGMMPGSDACGDPGFLRHASAIVSEGEDVPVTRGGGIEFPVIGVVERSPKQFEARLAP